MSGVDSTAIKTAYVVAPIPTAMYTFGKSLVKGDGVKKAASKVEKDFINVGKSCINNVKKFGELPLLQQLLVSPGGAVTNALLKK